MKYNRDQYLLVILQVLTHSGLVAMFVYGTFYQWLVTLFVYFLLACIGVVVTFHRLLAHKAFNPPKWFLYAGLFLGTLSLIGSSISWVALHRQHHRFTDKPQDPHAPKHKGILRTLWGVMLETPNVKYAVDLVRDPMHSFLHKWYFVIHLVCMISLYLIDPFSLVYAYLAPIALVWTIGGLVNVLNHKFGYRNHETNDDSTNFIVTGYIYWGDGWHNNHHANPSKANLQVNWWEFDTSGRIIELVDRKSD